MKSKKPIAIIGGGFLGALMALKLTTMGRKVELFEAKTDILLGATHLGEGKIHLGYTYGLAKATEIESFIQSSLAFQRLINGIFGYPLSFTNLVSSPFTYVVHRASLIKSSQFNSHYEMINQRLIDDNSLDSYFGLPKEQIKDFKQCSEYEFRTPERAIDLELFGELVKKELYSRDNLLIHTNTKVASIDHSKKVTAIELNVGKKEKFEFVLNCTWQQINQLDKYVFETLPTLNFRTKLYVSAKTNQSPTAITHVLGKFGDLVNFPSGRLYASHYESGLTSFRVEQFPTFVERENLPRQLSDSHFGRVIELYEDYFPWLSDLSTYITHERTVVAHGDTDIDDFSSQLHFRSPFKIRRDYGYISVLSYKFTYIPSTVAAVTDLMFADDT